MNEITVFLYGTELQFAYMALNYSIPKWHWITVCLYGIEL